MAIRLSPTNAVGYFSRGNGWLGKKEYGRAIADYNEAIRLDPKHVMAHNNKGIAWQEKKEHNKAIADYTEAIRLDPRCSFAYANRGNAWSAKSEYDKAIADCNEAIRLSRNIAMLTLAEALDGLARENTTGRSPTSTRPFVSTRRCYRRISSGWSH